MFSQNQAYPNENQPEKSQIFLAFLFPKKANGVKKNRISKSGIKKAKLSTQLHKNWECALITQENFQFLDMYTSPENLIFLFPCWDIMKCLNASMLKTAVFELVQQFYHATYLVMQPVRTAHALVSHSRQNKDDYFGQSELSRNTILTCVVYERSAKVVKWFLDPDDNTDAHQKLIITFWPIHNVPWNLHAKLIRGICIKSTY